MCKVLVQGYVDNAKKIRTRETRMAYYMKTTHI